MAHTWHTKHYMPGIYKAYKFPLDYIFISSLVVCRTPSWLSLLILTALRRFPKMFRWRTVGVLVPSFSLPATCIHRVRDPKESNLQLLP